MILAHRYHDFSAGHRVFNHESKCSHLHGHNYRIHFYIKPDEGLDEIGRVLDFSVIKEVLCNWLEENWDHKMLLFKEDTWYKKLRNIDPQGVVGVDFNPTAENMAKYLVEVVGKKQLKGKNCTLVKCIVEETRKCAVTFKKND